MFPKENGLTNDWKVTTVYNLQTKEKEGIKTFCYKSWYFFACHTKKSFPEKTNILQMGTKLLVV